jgi:hypothetical protein
MLQIGTQSVTTGGPASPDAMPQRRLIGPVGTGPARNRPRSSASTAIELLLTAARAALACADPQTALLRGGAARRLFRTQRRPWWYQQATFLVLQARYAAGQVSAGLLRQGRTGGIEP